MYVSVRKSQMLRYLFLPLTRLRLRFVLLGLGTTCAMMIWIYARSIGLEQVYIKSHSATISEVLESSRVKDEENHWRGPIRRVGVWPSPMNQTSSSRLLVVDAQTFLFVYYETHRPCPLVKKALIRYRNELLFQGCTAQRKHAVVSPGGNHLRRLQKPAPPLKSLVAGKLHSLHIKLQGPCEDMPHHQMDESYHLVLSSESQSVLSAPSVWGILRGLESFSHLVYQYDSLQFLVNETEIHDKPRFSHRGLLIDTSRHYLPIQAIFDTLDAMMFNKMNVLHWHIVDDHSFPYVSKVFPSLSEKGAYNPVTHVYTRRDVKRVISEAASRGIRVMVEFDTPGHTRSWGKAFPELLTACYTDGKPTGQLGPIDPSRSKAYSFLAALFAEVARLFPDHYIHLGGDEVNADCWMSNPRIKKFLHTVGNQTGVKNIGEFYAKRLFEIMKNIPKTYVVWQDMFDSSLPMPKEAVVQVWRQSHDSELKAVTEAGFRALLSSCWYLDLIGYGPDWKTYYACDPHDFEGNETQKALVLGGEACIWGEYVDSTNLISRTWPRASAAAERLWSPAWVNSADKAAARFEEHRCRMRRRGLQVEPQNGPGFCECDHIM
ncbi:beta-hexosaminidase subunit alpha-like [Haemaphysalis longicornis]